MGRVWCLIIRSLLVHIITPSTQWKVKVGVVVRWSVLELNYWITLTLMVLVQLPQWVAKVAYRNRWVPTSALKYKNYAAKYPKQQNRTRVQTHLEWLLPREAYSTLTATYTNLNSMVEPYRVAEESTRISMRQQVRMQTCQPMAHHS